MFGFVEKQGKNDNSKEQNQATHTAQGAGEESLVGRMPAWQPPDLTHFKKPGMVGFL